MSLSGQFRATLFICLFIYSYEKILSVQKAPKPKTNDFYLLGSFCSRKNDFLCCFSFAFFSFCWLDLVDLRFCTLEIFSQKKT